MLAVLAAAQSGGGSAGAPIILLVLLFGGMYFLFIRPQQRRVKAQRELQSSISVGDEVMTVGGIYGIIRHIDDDSDEITVEIAPGAAVRMIRAGIARRVDESEEPAGEAAAEDPPGLLDEVIDEDDEDH